MKKFKHWQAYWDFKRKILKDSRYIYDEETKDFFEAVLESAKERETKIKKDAILWRAQLGHNKTKRKFRDEIIDLQVPYKANRMKPLAIKAKEGRANPKGIPYLYLSLDPETAMAEIRPWIGSKISLGKFVVERELNLVDCSKNIGPRIIMDSNPDYEEIKNTVWSHIDTDFSIPVEKSDDSADYVPTQIISELFKDSNYDGIVYKSNLEEGHNIVLFNLDDANIISKSLYNTESISFNFKKTKGPIKVDTDKDE